VHEAAFWLYIELCYNGGEPNRRDIMKRTWPVLLAAFVALSCADRASDNVTEEQPPAGTPDPAAEAEQEPPPPARFVTTFNAGLARNYVPHVDARRDAIIAALADLDSEVICLQEVWEDADVDAVKAGVKARFPHAYHVATTGEVAGGPACAPQALAPLGECVSGPCKGQEDLPGCVMKECAASFMGLPGDCRTCLAANLAKPMDEALAACTGDGGSSLAYGGRNGLLLLSKHPLLETSHLVLDSFLLRRVALHAKVQVTGGDVDLFCTHLTAPLDEVEYQGAHVTWEREQGHQVAQLIEWVEETAAGQSAILMGDMNCGPAFEEWEVTASSPENFTKFYDAAFRSPYTQEHGHCTWCAKSNALIRGEDLHILDHVLFVRFGEEFLLAERVLDAQRVKTADGEVPLSDHYGVRVAFEVPSVKE